MVNALFRANLLAIYSTIQFDAYRQREFKRRRVSDTARNRVIITAYGVRRKTVKKTYANSSGGSGAARAYHVGRVCACTHAAAAGRYVHKTIPSTRRAE